MITATANLSNSISVTAQLLSVNVGFCPVATVENSDASYATTIASGGTLVLPNIDFTDSDGITTSVPSVQDIMASPALDVTEQINGVTIGQSASGSTNNQLIKNTAGTNVGTAANPSVVPNSQIQINGVNSSTVAATVTHNQVIQNSAATAIGTAANPSVIADTSITSSLGNFTDTALAESTYTISNVAWTDSDGSPQSTEYGQAIVCDVAPPVPSLAVALSSSTPNFGASVTITATPTNLTAPITYTFSTKNNIGDYVDTVQAGTNTLAYVCPFAGTFDIRVSAVDSLGASAFGVASITVGTIYAKHAITAAWKGGDSVLVSGQVDTIPDAVSNTYTASAPSSVTRPIKTVRNVNKSLGAFAAVGSSSTKRLATTISQLGRTSICYYAVYDNNADGISGAFGAGVIIGGSATPASNTGSIFYMSWDSSNNKLNSVVAATSGAAGASITSTNTLANGLNISLMSYDGTTLTLIHNGVTQTAVYSGGLWIPASCDIILGNTNLSSYTVGFTKPIWEIGVKTSNVADPSQLYADLLLKYGS